MAKQAATSLIPIERIERAIILMRGEKVMIESDLVVLYGVETRVLIQAVNRNIDRFPPDFMFQLTAEETKALRSQIVISNVGRGGRRYNPYAFTEQGVAMLSSVLHSRRAIDVNVEIMRAFVRLRQLLSSHADPGQIRSAGILRLRELVPTIRPKELHLQPCRSRPQDFLLHRDCFLSL